MWQLPHQTGCIIRRQQRTDQSAVKPRKDISKPGAVSKGQYIQFTLRTVTSGTQSTEALTVLQV